MNLQWPALLTVAPRHITGIRNAFTAKEKLDSGKLADFRGCPTSYMADPAAAARARMPWCRCKNCEDPSLARPDASCASDAGTDVTTASTAKELREHTRHEFNYDPEGDARTPDVFERRTGTMFKAGLE